MSHPNGGHGKYLERNNSFESVFRQLEKSGPVEGRSTAGSAFVAEAKPDHYFKKLDVNADVIEYVTEGGHRVKVCAQCWHFSMTCDGTTGTRHDHYTRVVDETLPLQKKRA